ncbi:hypothetical protein [Halobellus captivus]|uniref:hypothetical protein n=1 Tax=Halobellus captivus TaxID=2592614 RepID=UPI0011A12045|nr:hypothetical protein [Halobellus captivus]
MNLRTRALPLALVALLVVTAGCSGLVSDNSTATDVQSDENTSSPATTGTTSPAVTETHQEPTEERTGGDRETDGDDAATTGLMAVVVDGDRLNLSETVEGSVAFRADDDEPDTWHADDSVTLAGALESAGLDADSDSLSYGGTTYSESTDGTQLVYRVNGESVNPVEYELADGDEVWVLVLTEETDASVPGEYIPPDRLHVHGSVEFKVNGESLDFSRDKWQAAGHNSHFHFEGGHAEPWHAHSWSVTPAYAFSTLEDIDVNRNSITYNGTTYSDEDAGTTVLVTVNGEPVDPTGYYLKDGDAVRIVIETEEGA